MASTQALLDSLGRRFPDDAEELEEACKKLLEQRLSTSQRVAKLNDSQWERLNIPMGIQIIIREEIDKLDAAQPGTTNGSIAGPTSSSSVSDIRTGTTAASQNNPAYIEIGTNPSGTHLVSDTDAVRPQSDFSRTMGSNGREPDGDPADDRGTLSSNLTELRMANTASLQRWGTGPLSTHTAGNGNADALVPPTTPPPPPPEVASDAGTVDSAGSEQSQPGASPMSKAPAPNRRPANYDLLKRIEENEIDDVDALRLGDPGVHVKNTFLEVREPSSPRPAGAQSYPVASLRRRANAAAAAAENDGTGSAESDPTQYAPSSRRGSRAARNNVNFGGGGVNSTGLTGSQAPAAYHGMEEGHPWDGCALQGPPPHMVVAPWAPWPPHLGPAAFPQAAFPPQMMAYPNMIPLAPHPAAVAPPGKVPIQPRSTRKPQYSQGSQFHSTGTCKPCAWFWKPQGCENAEKCLHCHLCPEGELKARKKEKINQMRQGIVEAAPRW